MMQQMNGDGFVMRQKIHVARTNIADVTSAKSYASMPQTTNHVNTSLTNAAVKEQNLSVSKNIIRKTSKNIGLNTKMLTAGEFPLVY